MKSELRMSDHAIVPGAKIFEVWWHGELVCTVAGADGPGVRVISKYYAKVFVEDPKSPRDPGLVEVRHEL